ncbi:hypothetical protein [uncultured Peptoniphilus sp.]|uniref:hypothetical protein n=1 Tax=uncultured Peptoniphilus sp. TaxID=254354 RepID=UPI0008D95390|nr:hypothetical protein [uncultured Peptoniphilus sp.]
MSKIIMDFFKLETIDSIPTGNIPAVLNLVDDKYLEVMARNHKIDFDNLSLDDIKKDLHKAINNNFKDILLTFNKSELKSFNEFYQGIVDYSDEMVYINLKKFVSLGFIFLFLSKNGGYFDFVMPDELIVKFEDLLRNS